MKNKNRKKGTFLIVTGLLLIAAALILVGYNLWTDGSAGNSSEAVMKELSAVIAGDADRFDPDSGGYWVFVPYDDDGGTAIVNGQTGRWVYIPASQMKTAEDMQNGQWVFMPYGNDWNIPEMSEGNGRWMFLPYEVVENAETPELMILEPEGPVPEYPDYLLNPEMDMPELKVDGRQYIGVLKIPSLKLQLPIMGEWSYPKLRTAPCRYVGSVYQNNMVICGHNYDRHFGRLKTLKIGAEVDFTDAEGNVFRYKVVELETLKPYAVNQMKSGDWDLTLFTCTIGGRTRVTVRCERV